MVMKEVILVPVIQVEQQVVTRKCDHCGLEAIDNSAYGDFVWRFDLHFLEGTYTEEKVDMYGWGIEDLCPRCGDALKKLLEDNGYKTTSRQLDW